MEAVLDRRDSLPAQGEQLAALYRSYAPRCYRAALAVLREPLLAEEAVQETWLKAVRLARTTPLDEVERQLFTILKHTALDLLKKEKRYAPLPEGWDASGGEQAQDGAGFHRLVELIRALPGRYRDVLELKFLGECSNREIARKLGLGESTVATRVQRGRELLMESLRKEGYLE